MDKEKMSIKTLFKTRQEILKNKLNILLEHSVTKGSHCESAWIDFFRSFLPNKYVVDKGFVFDAKGNVSKQIDIIIYDALYTPLIFGTDAGEKFVTAESVYAIFEAKSIIGSTEINDAKEKIASVRKLERSRRGVINHGGYQEPRELTHIIGGILATDACMKDDTLENHITSNLCKDAKIDTCEKCRECHIDIGCIINKKAFIYYRDEQGNIVDRKCSKKENAILSFFYIVLDVLYRLGTVAGMDIREYAKATFKDKTPLKDENDNKYQYK